MLTVCVGICVYWLSHMWISSHIWYPKLERMAKNERIFCVPYYESTLIDQSMMLNRHRLDELIPDAGKSIPDSDESNLVLFIFSAIRFGRIERKPECGRDISGAHNLFMRHNVARDHQRDDPVAQINIQVNCIHF